MPAKDLAMIPYQVDPSLHATPPDPVELHDGFAPLPHAVSDAAPEDDDAVPGRGLAGDPSLF